MDTLPTVVGGRNQHWSVRVLCGPRVKLEITNRWLFIFSVRQLTARIPAGGNTLHCVPLADWYLVSWMFYLISQSRHRPHFHPRGPVIQTPSDSFNSQASTLLILQFEVDKNSIENLSKVSNIQSLLRLSACPDNCRHYTWRARRKTADSRQ